MLGQCCPFVLGETSTDPLAFIRAQQMKQAAKDAETKAADKIGNSGFGELMYNPAALGYLSDSQGDPTRYMNLGYLSDSQGDPTRYMNLGAARSPYADITIPMYGTPAYGDGIRQNLGAAPGYGTPAFRDDDLANLGFAGQQSIGVLALASAIASFYHGYKRHSNSVGWGLIWGLAGTAVPVVAPAYAIYQGYAKPEK